MSDPKQIGSLPPPVGLPELRDPQPTTEAASEEPANVGHTEETFQDDHLNAHNKSQEAARLRQVNDRYIQEQPRRIISELEKVSEAAAFRPAQDDEEMRKAERRGQNRVQKRGRNKKIPRRDPNTVPIAADMDLQRVEEKVAALWGDLVRLAMQQTQDAETPSNADETEQKRLLLKERRIRLETTAKHQIQHMLAGGIGLSLLGDPKLTFKRLFDQIHAWPKAVPPGYRPESEADFDQFLSWVFEPPKDAGGDNW